jgi:carbon starvation protein
VRRGGKSLAEIARTELGPWANRVVSVAILFIVVIALAGLGIVVVKALGGEEIPLPTGTQIRVPGKQEPHLETSSGDHIIVSFPRLCDIRYPKTGESKTGESKSDKWMPRPEEFKVQMPVGSRLSGVAGVYDVPEKSKYLVPGSSWGTFTIACTIPIALLVGLYMYRVRKGAVFEASLIGAALTLGAVVVGAWIPGSSAEKYFSLSRNSTVLALTSYGFIASVLPVWLLLCPRDYLSSFLKIGTIALLIVGVFVANPVMFAPAYNPVFSGGGPTFPWGGIFPFVFICIMCGAVSGFHALVSSGTTPKMIDKESQVRPIGYGAMLLEGTVGLVALVAAASLDPKLYYDINVDLNKVAVWQGQLDRMYTELGNADLVHLPVEKKDLSKVEDMVGGESLRGRTGGAVTLAVGMSFILSDALAWARDPAVVAGLMKYWYHFAIMFEALFILTTIDTGTRIARFLLQEMLGGVSPQFAKTDWLPGAVVSTFVVTAGWGVLVATGSIDTIWPMFGIANQLLAVVALALVTTLLINSGRGRYAPVTMLPMLFVIATTMTAATQMATFSFPKMIRDGDVLKGTLNLVMMVFVVACVLALLVLAAARWVMVAKGVIPITPEAKTPAVNRTPPSTETGPPGGNGTEAQSE